MIGNELKEKCKACTIKCFLVPETKELIINRCENDGILNYVSLMCDIHRELTPLMNKPAYLLILTGQGDTEIKVVDEETYNWIVSTELGKSEQDKGKLYWNDISCPPEVRKAIIETEEEGEGFSISIGINSYSNDRALFAPCIKVNGNEMRFSTVVDVYNWAVRNGYTIIDEYQGYIY